MSFINIKGQDSAIRHLKASIEDERIGYSYIFVGPNGVGKRLAAVNFAKALNCLDPRGADSCDKCTVCSRIDASNYPDVSVLSPEKEGQSVKIETMRSIIKDVSYKPFEGRKKVYIIDGADNMTREASNALLKTLEEPQSDAVIIFIANELSSMLDTIISRSHLVRFFPLNTEEVRDILVKEYGVKPVSAHILSQISLGQLGEAIKYKDTEILDARDRLIDSLLKKTFFDTDFEKVPKEDLKVRLDIMLTWFRDLLVSKIGMARPNIINIDRLDVITKEKDRYSVEYLDSVINQIVLTSGYVDGNTNQRLAMTVLAARIAG